MSVYAPGWFDMNSGTGREWVLDTSFFASTNEQWMVEPPGTAELAAWIRYTG